MIIVNFILSFSLVTALYIHRSLMQKSSNKYVGQKKWFNAISLEATIKECIMLKELETKFKEIMQMSTTLYIL